MKFFKLLAGCLFSLFSNMAVGKTNPLLKKWTGPYGGVPPFDKIKTSDFDEALKISMAELRKEIQTIANNPKKASFENTLVALEDSGQSFNQVNSILDIWSSSLSTPELRKIEQEWRPRIAAFQDEIIQNSKLFNRIDAIFNSPEKSKLNREQQRLLEHQETQFVLSGAKLNPESKSRVAAINQKLASLYTQFSQNLLADEESECLILENQSDIKGLPQATIEAAALEAERRKLPGKWVVVNSRSSMEPFLTYSPNRELREKAFRIWTSRGDNNNGNNNNKIVTEILKLRAERSKLLGFPSYAHWRLADTMAKDPKTAMELMLKVWKPAVERVQMEVADMQAIVKSEAKDFKIQAWDYLYYSEKVRKQKYDFDLDLLKPYLELNNIQKAMFWSAEKLFGLRFVQIHKIPVMHKSMTVYKVLDAKGSFVGLWYFDPYARSGKSSGAWMNNYRDQFQINGKKIQPIVSNNSNFISGKSGERVTISWGDAVTMFHEFGHALHGLSSNATYQSLSGTKTTRDFSEVPSQFNEHYLRTSGVLQFLVNKEGHPIPKNLLEKLQKSETFNSGFSTVEFLASGIIDMKLHLVSDKDIDPKEFEATALKEINMPNEIVMRHRIPQFGHIFSGEEYAAGYYGYLWAQVLETDAYEAFTESGDPYNKDLAKKYHDLILSVGNTQDPAEKFREFRGRDPKPDALLRARGFPL